MVDIQSPTTENRRGRKKKEQRTKKRTKKETTAAKYNGLPYWAAIDIDLYDFREYRRNSVLRSVKW